MTDHVRWGRWPICGAYGPTGGHVRVLGFYYGWIRQWDAEAKWSPTWAWSLFNLIYITHEPWRGTRWAMAAINLRAAFIPAKHRIGKREEARDRRKARRRLAVLRSQS